MLALFLSSLLSLFFFIVFGTVVSKAAKLPANLAEKLLLGLVTVNTTTTLLSLFFPVNGYILAVLVTCCLCILFFIRNELNATFHLFRSKQNIILVSAAFVAVAFFVALNDPIKYDSGLYHIQSIKWIEAYKAVPGLANLHGRFGFNPNIFTFFALTSLYDLFKQEIYSVNFAIFTVLAGYFVNVISRLFKHKGLSNMLLFFMVVFFTIMSYNDISSPTPDFLAIALPLFILARLVELSAKDDNSLSSFIPILVLSVYVLTIKLATVPLMLIAVLVLFKYRHNLKKIGWLLLLMGLIVLPWLARNVILTGWLVYPFPAVNLFSFDWQVPAAKVIIEKITVTGWARDAGAYYLAAAKMPFVGWFPIWWRQLFWWDKLFFIVGGVFPPLVILWQLIKKVSIGFVLNIVILTTFTGFIFWLFLAPDFRFGEAFITVGAISPLLIMQFSRKIFVKYIIPFIVIIAVLVLGQIMNDKWYLNRSLYKLSTKLVKPALLQTPPDTAFTTYSISGVTVYMPKKGDRCFCHAVPCVPHKDTTILLRGRSLGDGFMAKKKE
jgi:hypothetical protein